MRLWRTAALLLTFAVVASPSESTAGDEKRAIEAIENDLVADDPAVRAKAAAELTDRFPDGAVAVPMLVDLLDDESPDVVAAASRAIDSMAIAAATVVAKWCADDANLDPRSDLGTYLERLLSATKARTTADVIDVDLLVAGNIPPAVPLLACLLPDGSEGESTLPLLHKLLGVTTGEARVWTQSALALRGAEALVARGLPPTPHPARQQASAAAVTLVARESDMQAWAGCRLLSRVRPTDTAAIAALTDAAFSVDPRFKEAKLGRRFPATRRAACLALGYIGTSARGTVSPLLDDLAAWGDRFDPIAESVHVLLAVGMEAELLAVLAKRPFKSGHIAAALALEGRATDIVVPVLVDAVRKQPDDRHVVRALIVLGPAADDALHFARRRCRDVIEPDLKLLYLEAVLSIAPNDVEGQKLADWTSRIPGFARAVRTIVARHTAPSTSFAIRLAKGVMDAAAAEPSAYVFPLDEVLGLLRCTQFAKVGVAGLLNVLEIEDRRSSDPKNTTSPAYRRLTAFALGRIGPGAAAAIPTLTALRDKGDETIRVVAAQALRRIRAKK